jgi:hypothetical protein
MSTVVAIFEWPRMLETVTIGTPFLSMIEPDAGRRSWNLTRQLVTLQGTVANTTVAGQQVRKS